MRTIRVLFTAALLSFLISGCTAIGVARGLAADRRNKQARHATWSEVRTVPRGRQVEVALTSGDTLLGKFTGMRSLPADSYRIAYDSVRTLAGNSVLPQLNEGILVTPVIGRRVRGWFGGFEAEALAVRCVYAYSHAYFLLSNTVHLCNHDGQTFDLGRLRALAASRELPSTREFTIQCGGQTYCVPLERIQEVHVLPERTHKWLDYGVIGLTADGIVAAAVTAYVKSRMHNMIP